MNHPRKKKRGVIFVFVFWGRENGKDKYCVKHNVNIASISTAMIVGTHTLLSCSAEGSAACANPSNITGVESLRRSHDVDLHPVHPQLGDLGFGRIFVASEIGAPNMLVDLV